MPPRISLFAFFIVAASAANAEQSASGVNPSLPAPSAKPAQSVSTAPATISTRTGSVVVTISGVLSSNSLPPASRKLFCNVYVSSAQVPINSRRGISAAVISGNSFSCSIKLGYKWQVDSNDTLETFAIVFGVDTSLSASEAKQLGTFQPYGGIKAFFPGTTPFPASGATTFKSATGLVL